MEFQLQHHSNECSGSISFRIDRFDHRAVQGTLEILLQHYNSKVSILQPSAFFMVQLSHPYITTRKTTALNIRTFAGKVMSLLFNMLSRFVIFKFAEFRSHVFKDIHCLIIFSNTLNFIIC